MKHIVQLALILLMVPELMGGCVISKTPFYTAHAIVDEKFFEGQWFTGAANNGGYVQLEKNGMQYKVSQWDNTKQAWKKDEQLSLTFFKAGDHFFCDAFGKDQHLPFLVLINGSSLWCVYGFNSAEIFKLHPDAIAHSATGDDQLLSDTSEHLNKFLEAYGEELFKGGALAECKYTAVERKIPVTNGQGLTSKQQRTIDYWWIVRDLSRNTIKVIIDPAKDKNVKLLAMREMAKGIDDLSTLGVDEDLVKWSTNFVSSTLACADADDPNKRGDKVASGLVEMLLTGDQTVGFRLAAEQERAHDSFKASVTDSKALLKLLTSRYSMEYPTLPIFIK